MDENTKNGNRLRLIFLLIFALHIKADATEISKGMTYEMDRQYQDKIEMVSEVSQKYLGKKKLAILDSKLIGKYLPIHYLATDKEMNQAVLAVVGAKTQLQYIGKIFDLGKAKIYNTKVANIPVAIALIGFSNEETKELTNTLRPNFSVKNHFDSLFWSTSFADELTAPQTQTPNGSSETSIDNQLVESFSGCAFGIADGVNAVVIDPFVDAFGSAKHLYTDPRGFWEATVREFDMLKAATLNPVQTVNSAVDRHRNSSVGRQSRSYCSLVGSGGVLASAGRLSKIQKGISTAGVRPFSAREFLDEMKSLTDKQGNYFVGWSYSASVRSSATQLYLKNMAAIDATKKRLVDGILGNKQHLQAELKKLVDDYFEKASELELVKTRGARLDMDRLPANDPLVVSNQARLSEAERKLSEFVLTHLD